MEHHSIGTELQLYYVLPFICMLLSIALGPVLKPHFWHRHYPKVSFFWAAVGAVPLIAVYHGEGLYEILHILIADYIPFIILLWSLFTVGGGILIRTTLKGTPFVNAGFLVAGTALASWMGTTGAAMVFIRPFMRINKYRKYRAFLIIFFIFLVANIGGALTPLGDPPLFLGFLHGVPFFWTLNLFFPMILLVACLLGLFLAFDFYFLRKEQKGKAGVEEGAAAEETAAAEPGAAASPGGRKKVLQLLGTYNFLFLGGIVGSILMSGSVELGEVTILGVHRDIQGLLRDGLLVLLGLISLKVTPWDLRKENEFTWEPIREVAYLFFGIFVTMAPALAILRAGHEGALAVLTTSVQQPYHFFWVTGILSSFLDNAPTYLTFFSTALGRFYPGAPESVAVANLLSENGIYNLAIASGAVFFGAMTYIGNAPNFMVRSIAEEQGIPMPSFFGYMVKYSLPILFPLFLLVTLVFF